MEIDVLLEDAFDDENQNVVEDLRQVELEKLLRFKEELIEETTLKQYESRKHLLNRARSQYTRLQAEVQELTNHNNDINATFVDGQSKSYLQDQISIDSASPLSRELQEHPWPSNFKPKVPKYDGPSNPIRFMANYETAIISAGGDLATLAKSFVMAIDGTTFNRYSSIKLHNIKSWYQLQQELQMTIQGFQIERKTSQDLFTCVQREDEPLDQYIQWFLIIKAQAANVPDDLIIAAAIEG